MVISRFLYATTNTATTSIATIVPAQDVPLLGDLDGFSQSVFLWGVLYGGIAYNINKPSLNEL